MLSQQARKFLEQPRIGVLATMDYHHIMHQSPVWYELQDDAILMNTVLYRIKECDMRLNAYASLCVVDRHRYVTISGSIKFIDNLISAKGDILALASRYDGNIEAMKQYEETFSRQERISFRLPLETATIFEYFH